MEFDVNGREFAKVAESGQASIPNSDGDVIADNVSGNVFIPAKLGYGVTYEKINKFAVGVEAQFQDFSSFRAFNASSPSGNMGKAFKFSLGGQYIPNAFSLESLLSRSTIRAGIEYERLPFQVNQKNVDDIGINFGTSIPIYSMSLLNLALKAKPAEPQRLKSTCRSNAQSTRTISDSLVPVSAACSGGRSQ